MELIVRDTMTILKWSGAWRPIEWSSGLKRHLYSIYSSFISVVLQTYLLSQFVFIFRSINGNIEEVSDTLFIFCTTVCVVYKFFNILINRVHIVEMVGMLSKEFCKPQNPLEVEMQQKYAKKIRVWEKIFEFMSTGAVVSVALASFLARKLPFNGWVPFEYPDNSTTFWLIYTHQNYAHAIGAAIGTSFDVLFCDLLNLACIQLIFLEHRLRNFSTNLKRESEKFSYKGIEYIETLLLEKIVDHHLHIFKFTKYVNETFGAVILLQCTASTFILCASTYVLTKLVPFSPEFMFLVFYANCMLVEIYMYCWHGNEIITHSTAVIDGLYDTKWYLLTTETQKKLMMIMMRSLKPIEFKTVGLITLSLETYTGLLKLSYSIYNLLQSSGNSDPSSV